MSLQECKEELAPLFAAVSAKLKSYDAGPEDAKTVAHLFEVHQQKAHPNGFGVEQYVYLSLIHI